MSVGFGGVIVSGIARGLGDGAGRVGLCVAEIDERRDLRRRVRRANRALASWTLPQSGGEQSHWRRLALELGDDAFGQLLADAVGARDGGRIVASAMASISCGRVSVSRMASAILAPTPGASCRRANQARSSPRNESEKADGAFRHLRFDEEFGGFANRQLRQRARAGVDEIADAGDVDERLALAYRGDGSSQAADHALSRR
jgi:hypothetical protein